MYTITYTTDVVKKDIPILGTVDRARIQKAIETKLTTFPARYGKPLRAPQQGYWSLRVGKHRVIYTIEEHHVTVWAIGHRARVYET